MENKFYENLYDKFQQYDWCEINGFTPSKTETNKIVLKVLYCLLNEYSSCNPVNSYEYERVNFLLRVIELCKEKTQ